jgi:carbon storage regulator
MEGIAMLVLSRRKCESIVIDGGIEITVLSIRGDRVRLGIEAPTDVRIVRRELTERTSEKGDDDE